MRVERLFAIGVALFMTTGPVFTGLALAADGRIPIFGPTAITESGSYILTQNIGDELTTTPIMIQADNVDIDFNGFTVTGYEPAIHATGVRGVTLHDGFLIFSDEGIVFSNVKDFAIRRLVFLAGEWGGGPIYAIDSSNGVVEENSFSALDSSIGSWHLHAIGSNITIRDNRFSGSWTGIEVEGTGNMVLRNHLTGSMSLGITVSGSNTYVEGNVVTSCAGFGLHLMAGSSGIVYGGNVVRGNGGTAPGCPTSNTDFCDEGTNNTSHGDNYMPDEM